MNNYVKSLMISSRLHNRGKILAIYEYGSRVYRTHRANSDFDFIVVCDGDVAVDQHLYTTNSVGLEEFENGVEVNLTIYNLHEFQRMLDFHEISAIECMFRNNMVENSEVKFEFNLNLSNLRSSISSKTSNCWVKAKKKLTVGSVIPCAEDRRIGLKSLFHAFRILKFGIQLAEYGRIVDFSDANDYYDLICEDNVNSSWEVLDSKFRSEFRALQTEFRKLAPLG